MLEGSAGARMGVAGRTGRKTSARGSFCQFLHDLGELICTRAGGGMVFWFGLEGRGGGFKDGFNTAATWSVRRRCLEGRLRCVCGIEGLFRV